MHNHILRKRREGNLVQSVSGKMIDAGLLLPHQNSGEVVAHRIPVSGHRVLLDGDQYRQDAEEDHCIEQVVLPGLGSEESYFSLDLVTKRAE